jgi:predicted DNA-binding transcriptional regulator AlpA
MPLDETLTVDEFLRLEKISKSTLYAMWREGRGPQYHKIGRRILISAESRAAWRKNLIDEAAAEVFGEMQETAAA